MIMIHQVPDLWKNKPKWKPASEGMMFALMFGNAGWKPIRIKWFKRCNASGEIIWPGCIMWRSFITSPTIGRHQSDSKKWGGKYAVAWLSADNYIIESLKGNT